MLSFSTVFHLFNEKLYETLWVYANILFFLKLSTLIWQPSMDLACNYYCGVCLIIFISFISFILMNRKSSERVASPPTHLLVFLMIYLYHYGLGNVYFILLVLIPYFYLFCIHCSKFVHRELLQFGYCVFSTGLILFQ